MFVNSIRNITWTLWYEVYTTCTNPPDEDLVRNYKAYMIIFYSINNQSSMTMWLVQCSLENKFLEQRYTQLIIKY